MIWQSNTKDEGVKVIKKLFTRIDYLDLTASEKQNVYDRYVLEGILKLDWISLLVFICEFILMLLDAESGFFLKSPWNYLNLFAEMLLISTSFMFFLTCRMALRHHSVNNRFAKLVLNAYKLVLIIASAAFMFTDIYVRKRMLGAYMVLFFILQLIPFYHHLKNALLYLGIAVTATVLYAYIGDWRANTWFSTIMFYLCFYLTTNYLRVYYIKQLIYKERMRKYNTKFGNLYRQSIMALAETVEAKDDYTNGHSRRVAEYSKEIAKRLGQSEERQQEVFYIGLLHDVGKIGVPDEVINKKGRLTDEEYEQIKRHPIAGYDILKNITELPGIELGARYHHERYDGKGYPEGIKGEEIPLIARVVAVADAYDAMTSNRSYREVMPQEKVRAEIEKNKGTQFDPQVADVMLSMIDEDTCYLMRELC